MLFFVYFFVYIVLEKISFAEFHWNVELVQFIGCLFFGRFFVFIFFIVAGAKFADFPSGRFDCLLKICDFFLWLFSATKVLIHIYFFEEFADCLLLISGPLFIGTRT
jgi:hypothetical protein